MTYKPRLTDKVLEALAMCATHADAFVSADMDTWADDSVEVDRARKWIDGMRRYRALAKGEPTARKCETCGEGSNENLGPVMAFLGKYHHRVCFALAKGQK